MTTALGRFKIPKWLGVVLRWAGIILVFYFLGSFILKHWGEVRSLDIDFNIWLLVLSTAALATYFVGRVLVWYYLTVKVGTEIPLGETFTAWLYSQLGKYLPGKVFMLVGRVYFYSKRGRSRTVVSAAFVIETMATFASSIVTVLLALLVTKAPGMDHYWPALVAGLVGLIVALHPRVSEKVVNVALKTLKRAPVTIDASFADVLRFVGMYVVNWSMFGVAFWLFINSFLSVPASLILYLAGAFSLSSLIGMVSIFVPSGLGVREAVLILMLRQVIPVDAAIVISLTSRLWFTATELLTIVIAYFRSRVAVPGIEELESSAKGDERGAVSLPPNAEAGTE